LTRVSLSLFKRWRWQRLDRTLRASGAGNGLPDPMLRVDATPLLAIDLEMTGLDPKIEVILSIGWVPIDTGAVDLSGACEVGLEPDPLRSVGSSATIHGIRDCDRAGGQTSKAALQALLQALEGRVAVFHHAPLDTAFLDRAMGRELGFGWRTPSIDTLDWFRQREAGRGNEALSGSTRLEAVREHFGLDARSAHNAVDDAIACAEVALVLAARSRARLVDVCRVPGTR